MSTTIHRLKPVDCALQLCNTFSLAKIPTSWCMQVGVYQVVAIFDAAAQTVGLDMDFAAYGSRTVPSYTATRVLQWDAATHAFSGQAISGTMAEQVSGDALREQSMGKL